MKNFEPVLLSALSGILLWAGWPVSPLTFLIFIAFVPFLLMEDRATSRFRFFWCAFLTMLIWNVATTWWICNSTVPGGIAAIIANSFLMCMPLMGFFNVKRRLGETAGYLALAAFWLTFEYIHLNWQLSWPWLTLGNVFATTPGWVQWYEYTGTSGGSLWILSVNILIFQILKRRNLQHSKINLRLLLATILLLPFIISWLVKPGTVSPDTETSNIVVVQPNIDPYKKFEAGTQQEQLSILIRLSEARINANTSVVVWPETAINDLSGIDETKLKENFFLEPVRDFLKRNPQLKLLTGIEGYRIFSAQEKTLTARRMRDSDQYYNTYNTAGLLSDTGALQLYHKSKLVPGVETLPSFLKFIDSWFEQFGGTTGGYAPQKERTVLADPASGYKFAPAICYESIYGEFLAGYIRNGANVIAIITNDGWWANTSGHKQHMHYARLRAIEARRWIVRSANTGISCFISSTGQIFNIRPWDTEAAIAMNIPKMSHLTFYVKYGDLISKLAVFIAVVLFLRSIYAMLKSNFIKKNSKWTKH